MERLQSNDLGLLSGDWVDEWLQKEAFLESMREKYPSDATLIERLTVDRWRQFAEVDIVFHPRLTILTGPNGSGKTTLLGLIAPHFDWAPAFLTHRASTSVQPQSENVGTLTYSNGQFSSIVQHVGVGTGDRPISYASQQHAPGIYINSHRSVSPYRPLSSLPPRFSEWGVLQEQFTAEIRSRYTGNSSSATPLYRMKEALVSAAMHAYGNPAVRPNDSARELWEGFQEVLRGLLPASLEFDHLLVEDAEILLSTQQGEFPLEAVSGGISAMLELSWQFFLRQRSQSAFTVCIDEPENHLHPELQRSIVPALLAAFPRVAFIVATHSPFVVTSTSDSYVYALKKGDDGLVTARQIVEIDPIATPDETLMSVLGLDTALPLWAEQALARALEKLPPSPSAQDLRALRDELTVLGLGRQFPAALRSLTPEQ